MDGTSVRQPPVELQGSERPTVLTAMKVVDTSAVARHPSANACLQGRFRGTRAVGSVVERVGVTSETVTFREASLRGLIACDNSPGRREENRRWCGVSYGVLHSGRLRDPHLDVGCSTSDGEQMGFVWVQPAPATRYVAVLQPGYAEVYEVAAGLPVRVATTTDVEIEGSRASFDLSEHDASGGLVRKYRLEAAVAG
jgi:hypothetical protein